MRKSHLTGRKWISRENQKFSCSLKISTNAEQTVDTIIEEHAPGDSAEYDITINFESHQYRGGSRNFDQYRGGSRNFEKGGGVVIG